MGLVADPFQVESRHRLIPTQGRSRSFWVWGVDAAYKEALEYAVSHDMPVLVCSAPQGGIVTMLYQVDPPAKPKVKTKVAT